MALSDATSEPFLPAPASGRFAAGEHRFPLRVYFEDTDLSGLVYHANYLRYMERARSDMLRIAGIGQREALEEGKGVYAVTDLHIRYRRPARLDDDLMVVSRVAQVGAATCAIHQTVMRGDAILTQGDITVAFLTPQGRPRRQPKPWIDIFSRLMRGEDIHP
ncbi:acyl-CoA thioester hydrolase [Sphingobium wenxiniae]|uniref:Acyl-CoA thioester hydrolase n=1 Tax=Sphingobium wenxiniae (strain DSM 21828 / CGMCC 1.7748 / JZ-1) TaxID=595605 RepID=A0A562KAQ4_SPHWJ|nr:MULTISPECIES: YbgC/FadM family acyl-CoA thioesterase [Sphingobium]MBB6192111.1 acyl-CoA thioester hydrolase [Sphingobium wenxiniae]TWH92488.1 acyl-CoA thioester hydrolase [Sphingobium wenxiniae]WRD75961.1 YbgC/FadM family acyl-CoA thioesterase [Sphingobium baderi]